MKIADVDAAPAAATHWLVRLVRQDWSTTRVGYFKAVALALCAAFLLMLFLKLQSAPLKLFTLFGAVTIAVVAIGIFVNHWRGVELVIPSSYFLPIASGTALVAVGTWGLAVAEGWLWRLIAIGCAINGLYQMSFASSSSIRAARLIRILRSAGLGRPLAAPLPTYAFIATSTPGQRSIVARLVTKVTVAAFRHKYVRDQLAHDPVDERSSLPSIFRVAVPFIADFDLVKFPREFIDAVATSATMYIAVPSPVQFVSPGVDLDGVAQNLHDSDVAGSALVAGLLSATPAAAEVAVAHNERLASLALRTTGSIVVLLVPTEYFPWTEDAAFSLKMTRFADRVIHIEPKRESALVTGGLLDQATICLIDLLASRTLPLGRSDEMLSSEFRYTVQRLASDGLLPVADTYRRVRTAESCVERFLALLECYEVLAKLSVAILQVSRWQRAFPSADIPGVGMRPGFGEWVGALRMLCKEPGSSILPIQIANAWSQSLPPEGLRCHEVFVREGLTPEAQKPRKLLTWLDRIVEVRNATRGHGSIGERLASKLWPVLHEAFLGSAVQLRAMTLETQVVSDRCKPAAARLRGWMTWARHEAVEEGEFAAGGLVLEHDKVRHCLFPFFATGEGDVLSFISMKGTSILYSSCSSGQRTRRRVAALDVRELWSAEVDGRGQGAKPQADDDLAEPLTSLDNDDAH